MKSSHSTSSELSATLLCSWFLKHQRELPWRQDKEPYRVWLSEVILQQTQVAQGLPYFLAFIDSFPDVHALAAASEDEVLNHWQGLGYYSRARNLHKAAKHISATLNGIFPNSYEGLLELPGIGSYTAAAIASICYEEMVPVVDGNVQRVISRHFLMEEEVNSSAGGKMIRTIAGGWMEGQVPSIFNQAMMELGALICRPKSPFCAECPLAESCLALREGRVNELPLKRGKKPPVDRYLHFTVPIDKGSTQLIKRASDSIWAGLYEFPNTELDLNGFTALSDELLRSGQGAPPILTHVLSHQRIHAIFSRTLGPIPVCEGSIQVKVEQLAEYPMSRLMTRFLEAFQLDDLPRC